MRKLLSSIPEQLKRIFFLLIPIVIIFVILRSLLVPGDFGEIGHYRTSAVDEIISQQMKYAGEYICSDCHDDIWEIKSKGLHKNLSCEICHGPALIHANEPDSFLPPAPRERGTCPVCHEYLVSRPTGFPQIISASHNPLRPCIKCHEPHDPVPPEIPHECSACHKEIANIKSLSHHALISCRTCHETPENHKISPRQNVPSIPQTRDFCGECHSMQSETEVGIPKIELISHEPKYVCWQCHYPHLPEAK